MNCSRPRRAAAWAVVEQSLQVFQVVRWRECGAAACFESFAFVACCETVFVDRHGLLLGCSLCVGRPADGKSG